MLRSVPFTAPKWASALRDPPAQKLRLGHFPTPIFPFAPPGLPAGVKMYIKRDVRPPSHLELVRRLGLSWLSVCVVVLYAQDFSGMETSGNKIRKLEFLMADALEQNADCIVTCGGVQSNHCRATAAVARMLGLDSYLLLRTNKPDEDPGLVGNLLFDRYDGDPLSVYCQAGLANDSLIILQNGRCDAHPDVAPGVRQIRQRGDDQGIVNSALMDAV